MHHKLSACFGTVVLCSFAAQAQLTMSPLSGFAGADGWLKPSEVPWMGTDNLQRGMAFGNDHVYVASRTGSNAVHILNKTTGTEIGYLDMTGVSGGTFAINAISVATDGSIYVGNLVTSASASAPFKIYRWANESSAPQVVYSGIPLASARVGDTLDATGSGASARVVAGYGSTSVGYAVVDPTAQTATSVGFTGTPPNAGDFRLGLTFTDSSHVYGSQGATLARYTEFSGSTGTLLGSPALTAASERPMDWTFVNGKPLLATIDTTDSRVRVYDATDPVSLVLLGTSTETSNNANANASGAVAWGSTTSNPDGSVTALLYAMNSNNGLQAFQVIVVPEPSTVSFLLLGLGALLARRKFAH